jgi:hypothetical protein
VFFSVWKIPDSPENTGFTGNDRKVSIIPFLSPGSGKPGKKNYLRPPSILKES